MGMCARTIIVATSFLIASTAPSVADQSVNWARLRVGQTAYLAAELESDNDPGTRPVCRSNAEQIGFFLMQVNDCPHRRWGSVVVVTSIVPGHDDDRTTALSKSIPFVGIRAQNGKWSGWVQAISLEPIIPIGTRITMRTVGNGVPSVYLKKDAPLNSDVQLGSPVTVEVVRQDPPSEECSLLVRALTGPKRGITGWTCDSGYVEGTRLDSSVLNP